MTMRRGLRLAVWLAAVLALAGCYGVGTTVVQRSDDTLTALLAGEYYRFDEAPPESTKDWSSYRGRWQSSYEVQADPYTGLTFVNAKDKSGTPSPSSIVRVTRLDGDAILAQFFTGSDATFVFVLRRDADGILRLMDVADELKLRRQLEIKPSPFTGSVLMTNEGVALDREQVLTFLRTAAGLNSTTWPMLLVPRKLVDR